MRKRWQALRMWRTSSAREDGNLLVLGLGIWVIVLVVVVMLGVGIQLHNVRKELLGRADSAALAVVQEISDQQYYRSGSVRYDVDQVRAGAAEFARKTGNYLAEPTGVAGDAVVVTLCRKVSVPVVSLVTTYWGNVEMCATSSARLQIAGG